MNENYVFGTFFNSNNSEYNAVSIIYNDKVEKIEKNLKSYIANKIAKKIINNFIQ